MISCISLDVGRLWSLALLRGSVTRVLPGSPRDGHFWSLSIGFVVPNF